MLAFISASGSRRVVGIGRGALEAMDGGMALTDSADGGAEDAARDRRGRAGSDDPKRGRSPNERAHDRREAGDAAAAEADGQGPTDGGPGSRGSESDEETTRLEACMTPSGQAYYLRRGGTPRRRSALRLSRIIARQQLLRRLSQGRDGDHRETSVETKGFHFRTSDLSRFKQYQL